MNNKNVFFVILALIIAIASLSVVSAANDDVATDSSDLLEQNYGGNEISSDLDLSKSSQVSADEGNLVSNSDYSSNSNSDSSYGSNSNFDSISNFKSVDENSVSVDEPANFNGVSSSGDNNIYENKVSDLSGFGSGINNDSVSVYADAGTFNQLQTLIDRTFDYKTGSISLLSDYTYTANDNNSGVKLISYNTKLTIDGQGHTLNGDGKSRIFYYLGGDNEIILKNIIFINANVASVNMGGNGSVIYFKNGKLTFENCTFINNTAWSCGAVYVYSDNTFAPNLNINHCTFTNNHALLNGGAIYIDHSQTSFQGKTTISDSTFISNYVTGDVSTISAGGAIFNNQSDLEIKNSYFDKNHAEPISNMAGTFMGGAIFNYGRLNLVNSIFNENYVRVSTDKMAYAFGGAIYNQRNMMAVSNIFALKINDCLFKNNYVKVDSKNNTQNTSSPSIAAGGAFYNTGGIKTSVIFEKCNFTNNHADVLSGNAALVMGGAISAISMEDLADLTASVLEIKKCIFDSNNVNINVTTTSDGFYALGLGFGGAISNTGQLKLSDSTFNNNTVNNYVQSKRIIISVDVPNLNLEDMIVHGKYWNDVELFRFNTFAFSGSYGGAIYNRGNLNLKNSNFTKNSALISANAGQGYCFAGAIYSGSYILKVSDSSGSIEIDGCNFIDNRALGKAYDYNVGEFTFSAYGGALVLDNTAANIKNSKFESNDVCVKFEAYQEYPKNITSTVYGGAIYNIGKMTISNSNFTTNHADSEVMGEKLPEVHSYCYGGAIYNNMDGIDIDNCNFNQNHVTLVNYAKKLYQYAYGGAVYNSATGTVSIKNSKFNANKVNIYRIEIFVDRYNYAVFGGAIYNKQGTLSIESTSFDGNLASSVSSGSESTGNNLNSKGGVIYNDNGIVSIAGSNFTNNSVNTLNKDSGRITVSGQGGVIYSDGSNNRVDINNCIFKNNSANATGDITPYFYGGVICVSTGNGLNILNSNFTNNMMDACSGASYGGAIFLWSVPVSISNSYFCNNSLTAADMGGVMYADSNSVIKIDKSYFIDNPGEYSLKFLKSNVTMTSSLIQNSGGIWLEETNGIINYCVFLNKHNMAVETFANSKVVSNIDYNWWGDNSGPPRGHVPNGVGIFNVTNWIIMSLDKGASQGNSVEVSVALNKLYSKEGVISLPNPEKLPVRTVVLSDGQSRNLTKGIASFYVNKTNSNITATIDGYKLTKGIDSNALPEDYISLSLVKPVGTVYVGKDFTLQYLLKNNYVNDLTGEAIIFNIPNGMKFITASAGNGYYVYNSVNRTVTWYLDFLDTDGNYFNLTLRALSTGSHNISANVDGVELSGFNFTVNAVYPPYNPNNGKSSSDINSNLGDASDNAYNLNDNSVSAGISMQKTANPIVLLLFALLALVPFRLRKN